MKLGLARKAGCRQCLGVSCTQDVSTSDLTKLGLPAKQVADNVWVSLAPKTPVLAFHSTWPSLPNKQSAGYFRQFATETPLACIPHPVATR